MVNRLLGDSDIDVTVIWQNPMAAGLSVLIVFGLIVEMISIGIKGYRLIQSKNDLQQAKRSVFNLCFQQHFELGDSLISKMARKVVK